MNNNCDSRTTLANCTTVFFSNSFEKLAENLSIELFTKEKSPLKEKYVIVPCSAIKLFLKKSFASNPKYKIFAGIKVLTQSEALNEWIKRKSKNTFCKIPSPLELKLLVQESIISLCQEELPSDIESDLKEYIWPLNEQGKRIKLDSACKELAEFFIHLDLYGEKLSVDPKFKTSWKGYVFSFLKTQMQDWIFTSDALEALSDFSSKVHLFGFSYIPSKLLDFYKNKGANLYLFSPCREYWEDFCSEYEKIAYRDLLFRLQAKKGIVDSFESFIKDQHPLLASCGKKARLFLKKFATDDFVSVEDYETLSKADSLLSKIRKDLLDGAISGKAHLYREDDLTLRIHACPSKQREVEVLQDCLYHLIEKENEKGNPLSATDIVVVCPDLGAYVPYIQMVFGKKDSKLGYTIHNACSPRSDLKLFTDLIFYETSHRFDKELFISLLDIYSFREKADLSMEEVQRIKEWINKANIRFGFDAQHKREIAEESVENQGQSFGTWLHGFSSMLRGLALSIEDGKLSYLEGPWPINIVEPSEINTLKKILTITYKLYDLQKTLLKEVKTVGNWVEYFSGQCLEFLKLKAADESFIRTFERLSLSLCHLKNEVPFISVKGSIEEILSQSSSTEYSESSNRIAFWPFASSSVTGQRVVCMLGMDEESFPKASIKPMLQELYSAELCDDIILQTDENRFSFLEALSAAKDYVWISYTAFDQQHNPCEPSLVIKELLSVIKESYGKEVAESLCITHSPYGFDAIYFEKKAKTPSYSSVFSELAKELSSKKIAEKPDLYPEAFEEYLLGLPDPEPGIYNIDTKDLLYFALDPESYYKDSVLGIQKEWEEAPFYAEEFRLSKKEQQNFIKNYANRDFEENWDSFEKEKCLSSSPMKELLKEKLKSEVEQLKAIATTSQGCFDIRMDAKAARDVKRGNTYFVPSLEFQITSQVIVSFYGTLFDFSNEGVFIFDDGVKSAMIKAKIITTIIELHKDIRMLSQPKALLVKLNKNIEWMPDYMEFMTTIVRNFLRLQLLMPSDAHSENKK